MAKIPTEQIIPMLDKLVKGKVLTPDNKKLDQQIRALIKGVKAIRKTYTKEYNAMKAAVKSNLGDLPKVNSMLFKRIYIFRGAAVLDVTKKQARVTNKMIYQVVQDAMKAGGYTPDKIKKEWPKFQQKIDSAIIPKMISLQNLVKQHDSDRDEANDKFNELKQNLKTS